jgi:hypothetical protein
LADRGLDSAFERVQFPFEGPDPDLRKFVLSGEIDQSIDCLIDQQQHRWV